MRPTQWNLTSVILLSVLHFDPADCYLQHVEMQRNQITHHYNHSGHNLYNIYIHIIYIYINLRADSFMFHQVNSAMSLCNPTVFLCFMCHQVNGLGESSVTPQISLGISYWF